MTVTLSLNIDLFLLVFMRMTGFVILNPLFGRSMVPTILKAALGLLCAFLITPTLGDAAPPVTGFAAMLIASLLELAIGLAIGMIINILFAVVILAGELIDMQMGLSMAMMYDPGSGINMPVMGSYFNLILTVVFFAGNAHLTLLKLVSDSFKVIPPGTVGISPQASQFMVSMGKDLFELSVRMALPVIAVEVIGIVAIGLLMRAVPQINVFMVGVQIQSIIGILIVLVATPVITLLCNRLTTFILEKSAELIRLMAH